MVSVVSVVSACEGFSKKGAQRSSMTLALEFISFESKKNVTSIHNSDRLGHLSCQCVRFAYFQRKTMIRCVSLCCRFVISCSMYLDSSLDDSGHFGGSTSKHQTVQSTSKHQSVHKKMAKSCGASQSCSNLALSLVHTKLSRGLFSFGTVAMQDSPAVTQCNYELMPLIWLGTLWNSVGGVTAKVNWNISALAAFSDWQNAPFCCGWLLRLKPWRLDQWCPLPDIQTKKTFQWRIQDNGKINVKIYL